MEPTEPPPPYEPNGMPPQIGRGVEDEKRDLPANWIRQYDKEGDHQFFVDVSADPPRSIWHHPYDDEQYMSSLSTEDRSQIQSLHQVRTKAESSKNDHSARYQELPPRPPADHAGGAHKFGQKLKDKLTMSSPEEREAKRRQHEEEERIASERQEKFKQAVSLAAETGLPQFLGQDPDGKDVYVEPPNGVKGGRGQAPYTNPNARFLRPAGPLGGTQGGVAYSSVFF